MNVALLHRTRDGVEHALADGDLSIPTTTSPASAQLALVAPALASDCGDALVVRVSHPAGTETLFPFSTSLDLP